MKWSEKLTINENQIRSITLIENTLINADINPNLIKIRIN